MIKRCIFKVAPEIPPARVMGGDICPGVLSNWDENSPTLYCGMEIPQKDSVRQESAGRSKRKSKIMDIFSSLPLLLPRAIAWAEAEANDAAATGFSLNPAAQTMARQVGVSRPDLIRVALVEAMPRPKDAQLCEIAQKIGLLGPQVTGMTLGHSVFIRHGHDTWRLLSHEFRHVYQYEQAGSIAAYLPEYLRQIIRFGYARAPLEVDARGHEKTVPDEDQIA